MASPESPQCHDHRQTIRHISNVADDLKKAFDTVTDAAILEEIDNHYPGCRMYNYIASFL